jgi:hypothetical protein
MAKDFRKFKIAVAAVAFACALAFLIIHPAPSAATPARANDQGFVGDKPVNEIEGYKDWTKVNDVPQVMPERVATACAILVQMDGGGIGGQKNPHREKYYTVYVNQVGRAAMLEQKNPRFPEGSVIVKEKLASRFSESPELLTVMIKRRKGFNPRGGDWEYMVVDGTGTKIEGRGNLKNCQGCHLGNQKTDYIFRTYLSDEVANSLK